MEQLAHAKTTALFTGLRGQAIASLLQLRFVRYHRVQLGFAERPAQYEAFLREVVAPRLGSLPDPLGVFGAGEHTRVLLRVVPNLADRIHCFVDNNQSLWGQERLGRTVISPADAVQLCASIFFSTAVFQHVLRDQLKQLSFTGPTVAVDDVVPPAWFLSAA
jgi:hypothetical protein